MKLLLLFGASLLLTTNAFAQHTPPPDASLEFVENKGQWDAHARYAAALPSGRLFAQTDGLTFALLDAPALAHHGHADSREVGPADSVLHGHAVRLRFVGAASSAMLLATQPTTEHRNYFLGNDPKRWAQDVRGYRQLRYAGLWPGVDAQVYESADQQLEYDFELAAGADPAAIGLRHEGAEAVQLDAATGSLLLKTSVGRITERAPQAWQMDAAGRRQPVPCRYLLAADGTVRFALGAYDHQLPLTIDPVVVFSTYSGSFADNWGFSATYDAQGSLYSGGIVFDVGFPSTAGAFQTTFAALVDMAIIKYNTAVSGPAARVWATYLGGNGADFPTSLVVNSLGELLVLGATSSVNYPTTAGAVQRTFGGGTTTDPYGYSGAFALTNGTDMVITRFNSTGSALVGSTYLGGSGNDAMLPLNIQTSPFSGTQLAHNYGDPFRGDILVDAANNVYVASNTASPNFPLANGFSSTYHGGTSDGLVLKLTPALTAVTWGSYLGGSASDAAYSIQVAAGSGDVYVAGGTLSPNFPTTPGASLTTRPGDVDGFAVRIAANGQTLSRATYLGTSDYDQAYFLQLGSDGGVYVLGQTVGTYPTTSGLYRTTNGRQFIHKLDANLATTQIATVFGSGRNTVDLNLTAFLVDQCDRVYVCGWGGELNTDTGTFEPYLGLNGTTINLPTTTNAVQRTTDGKDFYLAQFSAGLTSLDYGTFYGAQSTVNIYSLGDHVDGGTARFDPRGVVYQAVCSCGDRTGFPIPLGANFYSATNNSGSPPAVGCNNAAFVFNFQPNIANAGADQSLCANNAPVALVGTPAGGIWSGPGVTGSVATGFTFTPSLALLGVQTLTYTVASTGQCTTTGTRRITVGSPTTVTFAALPTVYCRVLGDPTITALPLVGTPAGGTFAGPGVVGSTFDPRLAGNGTHTLTYTYTNGCTVVLTQQVRVALVSAGTARTICSTSAPFPLTGNPAGGVWTGPGVSGSLATSFVFTPSAALAGANTLTYTLTSTSASGSDQCTSTSPLVVNVLVTPAPIATPLPVLCTATTALQPLVATPAGGTWTGPGVSGSVATGYFFRPGIGAGTYQLTYLVGTSPCQASATLIATVFSTLSAVAPADTLLCPGSNQPFRLRATPAGGTWTGSGVSGSTATGYFFTLPPGFSGTAVLTYSVVSSGCTGTATRRVSVAPAPVGVPTWAPQACPETRLAPLTVNFQVPFNPATPYTGLVWEFGDGTQSTEASPAHTYTTPGTYQPRLRLRYNQGRCEVQTALPPVAVQERKVPNIITPNGDKLNETFQLGPDCPPRLQVFSRWGQPVFESAAYHDEWGAAGLPDGVYYYLLSYPDGHRVKGWVEVLR